MGRISYHSLLQTYQNHQSEPSCVLLQSAILLQLHKYVAPLIQTKMRLHALIEDFFCVYKIHALPALCH